ncbi:2OG-Fe(II) oxygenase [Stappia sp.]|uniref:2OG-Fe(II) oxygenase n=1 Tax=Stappia sp. TaxID=1870903 RepID=UPI003D0D376C
MTIELRQDLNIDCLREAQRERQVLSVKSFLEPSSADTLSQLLSDHLEWSVSAVDEARVPISISAAEFASNSEARSAFLMRADAGDPNRFRYLYGSYHLMRFHQEGRDVGCLDSLVSFLTSHAFEDAVSRIFELDVSNADAHLASYGPGHFLNRHTDAVAPLNGRRRAVAFVLNFTQHWRSDWGGLTTFWPHPGEPGQTYTPEFNSALLFRVPIDHSVGIVARSAPHRLSVAGWLHEGA